jgi:hypothetical protein
MGSSYRSSLRGPSAVDCIARIAQQHLDLPSSAMVIFMFGLCCTLCVLHVSSLIIIVVPVLNLPYCARNICVDYGNNLRCFALAKIRQTGCGELSLASFSCCRLLDPTLPGRQPDCTFHARLMNSRADLLKLLCFLAAPLRKCTNYYTTTRHHSIIWLIASSIYRSSSGPSYLENIR